MKHLVGNQSTLLSTVHTNKSILTKVCNGVDISVARHLNWVLKISMRDSAVGESETLNFTRLVRQLPKDLH